MFYSGEQSAATSEGGSLDEHFVQEQGARQPKIASLDSWWRT